MSTKRGLQREAREAFNWRGHHTKRWRDSGGVKGGWSESYYLECDQCGRRAYIDPNPAPNSTHVYGEAVAVECSR